MLQILFWQCDTSQTGLKSHETALLMPYSKCIGRETNRPNYQPTSMSIPLTANYKETLPSEIVEIIDNLVEDGRDLEEVLSVYDYFGEEYAKNLEVILEVLENTDASKSDLYDFIEEHGVENLEYFEKYSELRDDHDPAAVDAFISLYSLDDLKHFEDVYEGHFNSVEDFVVQVLENSNENIPSWLCIDYEATWNCFLRYYYCEENDYYFQSNW